jgi:hypothetical protein
MRRRYPAPWKVEEHTESYAVVDAAGQRLAFVYFEEAAAANDREAHGEGRCVAARPRDHARSGPAASRLS